VAPARFAGLLDSGFAPGSYRATLIPVDVLGVGSAPRGVRFVVRVGRR
jgi:hypothetical protein